MRFGGDALAADAAVFIHAVFVHRGFAGDNGFAEAESGVDEDGVDFAAHGINGEGDACCTVCRHIDHLLDDNRHCRAFMCHTEAFTVRQDFGIPQAEPALFDGGSEGIHAMHVEQGVVQAGKGGAGQVFGAAGGAHRKIAFRMGGLQDVELRDEHVRQGLGGKVGGDGGALCLRVAVFGEQGGNVRLMRRKPGAVGVGRQDDTVRYGQSGLGGTGKAKAFAANAGDIKRFGGGECEQHGNVLMGCG